ncbi:hypothetical protein ACMYR3_16070 [Ampullimonas aquatilis]|uniref:hypothetical protein n=1 Tax=Ampullimonas aquatilis TaxID=1341549 RepID=UPI003C745052
MFAETLIEFGWHAVVAPFQRQSKPWLAGVGYALFGALIGAISLWPFPNQFVTSYVGRLVGVGITPVIAGLSMMTIGAWRRKLDQPLIRIDRFAYGYLFALGMAVVRFIFGH